jgi:hypothetical protein
LVSWWSCWVLAYSFHSSWVVWLRFLLFFSLISILSSSSEILSSTFYSLLEWPSTVFFVWLMGLFISNISVWFFFLMYSISLFNSSFMFYVVFFISYISFFIVSFGSLWYLLKSSLSSFICFCVFSCSLFLVS